MEVLANQKALVGAPMRLAEPDPRVVVQRYFDRLAPRDIASTDEVVVQSWIVVEVAR
ncbi:hypothetical protein Poly30_10120 [Planctomycetes bacterium Poly30]|uniref:Uncharacterized protein n=1 Tax=Saltatorellus ferox TaxID=2528018 RepID=A0A518EN55_9BACT|nr:hypothetical protein Poly30_10120 [Planctomycetes bacterium Poly30]